MAVVAPLFGADKERAWAPGWNPSFIWPAEPRDQPGMVFTIAHGPATAVWVNTRYDLAGGRFQYVCVIPDLVATVITLKLKEEDKSLTHVSVQYDRTALSLAARERVEQMAFQDAHAGAAWSTQINLYLAHDPHVIVDPAGASV